MASFKINNSFLKAITRNAGNQSPVNKANLQKMIAANLQGVANPAAVNTAISSAFANVGSGGICAAGVTPLARRLGIPDVKGYGTTGGGAKGAAGTGISVLAGSGVIDTFLTAANWQGASSDVAFRKFLLGDNDPKNLDPIYRHATLERVEAYVEVYAGYATSSAASTGIGTIDRDLSETLTGLFERNFAVVVDPDGLGDNFQLAPTFLADMPVGGLAFDADNQPTYQNKGFVRFDYCGAGELSEYLLADYANADAITISVYFTAIGHFDLSAKMR